MGKQKYLFHNSFWFYRPLWTYETELHGSKTVLYFYSANSYGMNFGKLKTPHAYGFKLMRWNLVYVWNDFQKKYLENINNLPKYLVMGAINLLWRANLIIGESSSILKSSKTLVNK